MNEMEYVMWRLDMWLKGYGSYIDIEKAVFNGELIPGKNYPDKKGDPHENQTSP